MKTKKKEELVYKIYNLIPRFNFWRLPAQLNSYLAEWEAIDRRKDRSISARDFRFWLYLRLNNAFASFFGYRK